MAGSIASAQHAQVVPQGSVDHRMRATGSGYAGGPTATSGKGPPADLGAGRVAPPAPPPRETAHRVNLRV